ncbi:unnamed protein product [Schistosoma guineensis]|nr:unnamed protein product [Schistosoma guineensis]
MHIGHGNSYRNTIESKPLPCVQEHKDLGVILSHDLKTTTHCKAAAVKGFRALWSLRRAFKSFDEGTFRILYPIYVRPHLKYCIQAASPCLVKDTNSLERVQRVGTELVKGLSRLPYDERLKRPNFLPLSYRRTRGDLILAFRIFNYDLGVNMSNLFAPSSTNNLRGHSKKVRKPRSNKLKVVSRFSHRVVNDWNALPEQVVSASSVILRSLLEIADCSRLVSLLGVNALYMLTGSLNHLLFFTIPVFAYVTLYAPLVHKVLSSWM